MARIGRRPGATDTRAEILDAARRLFGEKGYETATIRAIAHDAGVDPALVHHFFGTKERVFVAAMELPFEPADALPQVLGGGIDGAGERAVRFFLSIWREPEGRAPFLALLRGAATNEQAAAMMREFVTTALLGRVAEELHVPRLRVTAAASQLVGLAMLRYVVGVEPLASADEETVVAMIAPTVQRYLEGTGTGREHDGAGTGRE